MKRTTQALVIGIGLVTATLAAYAQQPADADKTAPAAPAASTAAALPTASETSATATPEAAPPATQTAAAPPASPSPETLKRARQAGYRPEVRKGVTLFCREDATLGTRFTSKKCIDEVQLTADLDRQQQLRDQMNKAVACGAGCSGH